jgi:hypothetical protein
VRESRVVKSFSPPCYRVVKSVYTKPSTGSQVYITTHESYTLVLYTKESIAWIPIRAKMLTK